MDYNTCIYIAGKNHDTQQFHIHQNKTKQLFILCPCRHILSWLIDPDSHLPVFITLAFLFGYVITYNMQLFEVSSFIHPSSCMFQYSLLFMDK